MQTEEVRKAKPHTTYKLKDGTLVPGVTTALNVMAKAALVPWANKLGLQGIEVGKYVDALADVGTLAHYMILCHLKNDKPDLSDYSPNAVGMAENCFLSYLEWEKNHKLEPIKLETPLVSEEFHYGGTMDFFGIVDGIYEIIDFKTGKAIYDEYFYQAAAYEQLASEMGAQVDRLRILQIGRSEDEGFSEKVITEWDGYWAVFEACLNLYNAKKANGKRAKRA